MTCPGFKCILLNSQQRSTAGKWPRLEVERQFRLSLSIHAVFSHPSWVSSTGLVPQWYPQCLGCLCEDESWHGALQAALQQLLCSLALSAASRCLTGLVRGFFGGRSWHSVAFSLSGNGLYLFFLLHRCKLASRHRPCLSEVTPALCWCLSHAN